MDLKAEVEKRQRSFEMGRASAAESLEAVTAACREHFNADEAKHDDLERQKQYGWNAMIHLRAGEFSASVEARFSHKGEWLTDPPNNEFGTKPPEPGKPTDVGALERTLLKSIVRQLNMWL